MRLLITVALLTWAYIAHAKDFEVRHEPQQPRSGQAVVVTATLKSTDDLVLQYQVVDPGKYIARKDAAFERNWTPLPMTKSGDSWKCELPANLQTHRRLIRYRIVSSKDKKRIAPAADDAQSNFAYFVYDGVPDWKGAINPSSRDAKAREVVTFPSAELQKVAVYHLIGNKTSIENTMWNVQKPFHERNGRNSYDYAGTLVYDGIVYDHVGFRSRGGEWRYAMGKNMWKFNFLPGHRLQARDNWGQPYDTKWDKLNLGACIQQGEYGLRGEQGMFEAIGFRMFNLAGVEASNTHWVHFRIIDEADEAPREQYSGDFWGLYLAVENLDGHFVKEHRLPAGNLYKMTAFGPETEFAGAPALTNQFGINQLLRNLRSPQPEPWWRNSVEVQRYFSYRAIVEAIHHYDISAGKNYFFYLDPNVRKWTMLPWDLDLSWSDGAFGSGHDPFYRAGLTQREPFKTQYLECLAEFRDLLFNPEQMNQLIDQYAAVIKGPRGIAAADRAKWDFHPALNSRKSNPGKAGQGRFYFGDPNKDFRSMVAYMKSYASKRMRYIDSQLLAGYQSPDAPKISAIDTTKFKSESPEKCAWRLAEVNQPNRFEITPLWQKTDAAVEIPRELIKPGHTYRVRARRQDSNGHWSRWSAPIQFTAPAQ